MKQISKKVLQSSERSRHHRTKVKREGLIGWNYWEGHFQTNGEHEYTFLSNINLIHNRQNEDKNELHRFFFTLCIMEAEVAEVPSIRNLRKRLKKPINKA